VSCCCEKLVAEAGDSSGTQRRGTTAVEAATKQRLVKTVTDWEDLVCPIVICEL
jgi:hypothetical protein